MTTDTTTTTSSPTTHEGILRWVNEIAELTQPDSIHWCTGDDAEWEQLTNLLVESGTFTRLNPEKKPNSFLAQSDPTDVARVEDRTFICSVDEKDAGPTSTGDR
jgi:phosphoenolpyruvate carboxykinase (GTP)